MEETSAAVSSSSKTDIRLSDCICPICMSILLEPVTMPCAHELCRPCFRDTVEQVNFTCPLCRMRISNWARKQARVNKLINWTRWKEIQTAFPDHCRKRLEGEDDTDVLQPVNPIRICQPGEVRKEYEQQMRELQKQREEEERIEKDKSQRAIKAIQEEELQQYEERRQEEERLMALDEQLARKLAGSEEPPLHVIGNLADEQARLDEQLARTLQEEQDPLGVSNQTQKDEEFARRLQEELEKTSITSKNSSKCSTPRSKNATKIPAVNIERFFTKMQPGESSQNLSCNSSGSSSKDDVLPSFATFDKDLSHSMNVHEMSSPEKSCSRSSMDSNIETFFGPSTSKVIEKADVSLICMEDYRDEPIEVDENSNTQKSLNDEPSDNMVELGNEQEKSDLCLMDPSFSATQFDECSLLGTKDLTPSPIAVLKLSPPTDVEDDETRSNQEEVALKSGGAFSPILKSPPTGVKRTNAFRSDSVGSTDSISHELSHFRPIVVSPRTAARKLADGKPASTTLIHSTPTNLQKALDTGESDLLQKSPLLMAKWLSLAQEREKKVLVGSKCVMAGKSVIQEQDKKKSFLNKLSNLNSNSNKLSLDLKNDPGNITDKNSVRMCSESLNLTDEVETLGSADIPKNQSSNWLSCESPVAATTTTGSVDKTLDDHKAVCSSVQTGDTVKRSPGKVYHMKDRTPSHSRRKNLTKLLTSSCEDTNVSTFKFTSKEARIDKSILSKIVKQKEDKHRKMEDVKTDDTNFNEEMNHLDEKEIIVDEKYRDLKKEDDSELRCNHEIRCNDEINCSNMTKRSDSIIDKNGCSQYNQLDKKIGNNYQKHEDQPHGAHSEEKSIKKKNQTAESQGKKQQNYKNCRTIEDMFAKFQKQLGTDDFKSDKTDINSVKTSSVRNSSERKIDEDVNDNEKVPRFGRSPKSPVQDHQILILNQTLSFKQKTDSGKLIDITKPSVHQRVGNKRKNDETPEGKHKFKFRQVSSFSSPKKAQRLGFSPPKKAKQKGSKGKTHTRNDTEPLSPGTLKHNRFLKLQTKEERRLEQEELDRQVALKLQRQLDREIKAELNNVSRARGSESEYQLRSRKPTYKTVL